MHELRVSGCEKRWDLLLLRIHMEKLGISSRKLFSTIIGVTTSQVDGRIAKHTKVSFR